MGEALLFAIPAEDSAEAATTGSSGMAINRIQYQDADFNPTISRTPAFIMMKDANGLCLTSCALALYSVLVHPVCVSPPPSSPPHITVAQLPLAI